MQFTEQRLFNLDCLFLVCVLRVSYLQNYVTMFTLLHVIEFEKPCLLNCVICPFNHDKFCNFPTPLVIVLQFAWRHILFHDFFCDLCTFDSVIPDNALQNLD